ncbi:MULTISPECIES: GNAT family N-acetyltransferase [Roseateles]|uniref:GNAT family N-acetyltransferase n=1 Tax=Pelomonas caseinilytica TaxID=2906763 RepID=A0ABS8XEA2_9BURK|nr:MULTISPECIES: GNAT family N-acetyltransferase [unclassified Roseateles]MCE4537565.1 GNAT family N-acetyltransferase [Pelomonas sp. P7]HEV6968617.1 GNAT family N-acetyltransferase [Roseateles sp.]
MPTAPLPTPAVAPSDPAAQWDEVLAAFGPDPNPPPPAPEPEVPAAVEEAGGPLAGARAALERLSTWVPIRALARRHRHRVVDHLLALDPRDRYLRFGYAPSDEQIRNYVLGIDFSRDEVLGVFNRRLQLVALAHLAYGLPMPGEPARRMAEFGVSVLPQSRGRGLGRRLFDAAALHARNRGIDTLFIHALSENRPMLRIATAAGATVERDGSESAAWLRLPPDTVGSQVEQALERHLGELDFQFKRQARVLGDFVDSVAEVKAHFDASGRAAKE